MLRLSLTGLVALVLLTGDALAQSKPGPKIRPDAVPGYKIRTIEGFTVLLSDETLKENDASKLERKPLDVLDGELKSLSKLMPTKTLTALRNVAIWVEWDEPIELGNGRKGVALATYYGGHQLDALAKGMNPLKAKNVTIHRMKLLTLEHQPKRDSGRCVVLHEIAHAVQDQVFGNDNIDIKAAYKQAMERNLLDKRMYAATNELEFFAEMTCAYFDQLDYYPRTRDDLKKLDPVTFKLMEGIWGKRKADTVAKGSHGGPDPKVRLDQFKLGTPITGPKVTADDLKDRAVLLVLWNVGSPSSVNFLRKAVAWDSELRDFGLATVAVQMTGSKKFAIGAAAKGLSIPVTDTLWVGPQYVKEFKEFPVALVFGHDGRCVYHGPAFDAEEAVRAAVGDALAAKAVSEDAPKGVAPIVDALRKGKSPPSLLSRLAPLTQSPDANTAAAAKALVRAITEGGQKAVEEAEAMAKDDPVAAFLRVEHVPTVYKQAQIATKAANLISRLKSNRAVALELRARKELATVQKIDTELGSRPGSFDPSQEGFRRDNALLLRQLQERVLVMKKSWPKSHATDEATHIAEKYGIAVP
jgi:hypothetical protein